MRALNSFIKAIITTALVGGIGGLRGALATGGSGAYTDTCGQVNAELKVPQPLIPQNLIGIGIINACICVTDIPVFITTNVVAIAGTALAGKTSVISAITSMVQAVGQVCHYPDHAIGSCIKGAPCNFQCKDGYQPSPATKPTSCICPKPYLECNGKCGLYKGCPSGKPYYRRDSLSRELICPTGMEACGIWGRNARTWECVDTMSDLESCGGCVIHLPNGYGREGQDCTALPGVSDVSCVQGQCVVHKCMPGYDVHASGAECVYNEDEDPLVLAAQYGVELN
ncbi:hypothetical protein P691DRAFT_735384 [Macrolepiota fuliginosa MF-IS2]|uniref:Protein CPL1-like domain-containing protein n=1 Tax=Macrolepiota fuliginosa MF-IS2 TaxID=1400762 RepID=A0A9P5X8B5_9AGAR|nr:hypothetical protein P691DRAFT_735384 [Macrolepiota fuliginosa MF-IS2]